jgi:hypothetical protein
LRCGLREEVFNVCASPPANPSLPDSARRQKPTAKTPLPAAAEERQLSQNIPTAYRHLAKERHLKIDTVSVSR